MEFDFSPFLRFIAKSAYFINEKVMNKDCRILYVVSGGGTFETNDEIYHLNENTLIFYPYKTHYLIKKCSDDFLFYTLNFDFTNEYKNVKTMVPIPSYKNDGKVLDTIPSDFKNVFNNVITFNNALWAESYVKQMHKESLKQAEGYMEICDSILKVLLIEIYRSYNHHKEENVLCKNIKNIVNDNLKMNIKEIAEVLNYHPNDLNEAFKRYEGVSLHKYISKQRLICANELILTTQKSLEEIAEICGYSSLSHFSAAFKGAYQICPISLRKQI